MRGRPGRGSHVHRAGGDARTGPNVAHDRRHNRDCGQRATDASEAIANTAGDGVGFGAGCGFDGDVARDVDARSADVRIEVRTDGGAGVVVGLSPKPARDGLRSRGGTIRGERLDVQVRGTGDGAIHTCPGDAAASGVGVAAAHADQPTALPACGGAGVHRRVRGDRDGVPGVQRDIAIDEGVQRRRLGRGGLRPAGGDQPADRGEGVGRSTAAVDDVAVVVAVVNGADVDTAVGRNDPPAADETRKRGPDRRGRGRLADRNAEADRVGAARGDHVRGGSRRRADGDVAVGQDGARVGVATDAALDRRVHGGRRPRHCGGNGEQARSHGDATGVDRRRARRDRVDVHVARHVQLNRIGVSAGCGRDAGVGVGPAAGGGEDAGDGDRRGVRVGGDRRFFGRRDRQVAGGGADLRGRGIRLHVVIDRVVRIGDADRNGRLHAGGEADRDRDGEGPDVGVDRGRVLRGDRRAVGQNPRRPHAVRSGVGVVDVRRNVRRHAVRGTPAGPAQPDRGEPADRCGYRNGGDARVDRLVGRRSQFQGTGRVHAGIREVRTHVRVDGVLGDRRPDRQSNSTGQPARDRHRHAHRLCRNVRVVRRPHGGIAQAGQHAAGGERLGAAVDRVRGEYARAAQGQAEPAHANRAGRRERRGVDGRALARFDPDVARGRADLRVADVAGNVVIHFVVGDADADGKRRGDDADGCGHRHRAGQRFDRRGVGGVEVNAASIDAPTVLLAVDVGLHQRGDAVFGGCPGTTQRCTESPARQRHRASDNRCVNRLVGNGVERQGTDRVNVRVVDVCLHLGRVPIQADELPLRSIGVVQPREPVGIFGRGAGTGTTARGRGPEEWRCADVAVHVARAGSGRDFHRLAVSQTRGSGGDRRRIVTRRVVGRRAGVRCPADVVARDRHADRPADAHDSATHSDRDAQNQGVDRRGVPGVDIHLPAAADGTAVDVGVRSGQDDVVGVGPRAAHAHAAGPEPGGQRRRHRHGPDAGGFGRRDRQACWCGRGDAVIGRVGARAVGPDDVGRDVAGDGVAGQRDAQRHRPADEPTGDAHRDRGRHRRDARVVAGVNRNAVRRDAATSIAVDVRLDIDADLVLRKHAGAAQGDARRASPNRHRPRHHHRADRLPGHGVQRERAIGADARIGEVRLHLGRRFDAGTGRPADEVPRHCDADGCADASVPAPAHRGRKCDHHGRDCRGAGRAQRDIADADEVAVRPVGVSAAEDHVLGHRAGTAGRQARVAADPHCGGCSHGHRADRVAVNGNRAAIGQSQGEGRAVGCNQRPALAGH